MCEKFSISRQTARQAISVLEKEGLILKKQGSGTYVSQIFSEAKTISKNIGLVTTNLDDYIFPAIISGVEKVLSSNGYNTTLRLTRNRINNEREQLLSLLKSDIDGLIVEGTKSALPNPNLDIYRQFADRGIPVVFINNYYSSLNCNFVVVDDEKGGRLATRYLIEQGHQKMYDQNLSVDESTIIWYSTENAEQQFSIENLPTLLKKLDQSTAIVCYNDQISMKLMQLLSNSELSVPEDLSLVSFDNSSLSQIGTISLTSVTHPGKELGRLAAESILMMIENPDYEIKYVYEPELIVRQSVKKL